VGLDSTSSVPEGSQGTDLRDTFADAGGVRVRGQQLSATKAASSEQCCTLCASASPPGACAAWTFNTVDNHCQSFRLITSSDKCNVCEYTNSVLIRTESSQATSIHSKAATTSDLGISGRVSADEGATEGVLNELDPHMQPSTSQHLYLL
jgi:hypothetical protein